MGTQPSSPKAGIKLHPVKTIILKSPISDSSSPLDQNKLPIANNSQIDHGIKQSKFKASFFNIVSMIPSNNSLISNSNTSQTSVISTLDVYENRDAPENYYSLGSQEVHM